MSGGLADPGETYPLLKRLEKAGYFSPWGMVETVDVNGRSYLPMNGSLNAGFETLGAYHLLARNRGFTDMIYETCRRSSEMRRAVQLFYPETPLEGKVGAEAVVK